MTVPCVYTIPAGLSFVDVLADGILKSAGRDDPMSLAKIQILLPTRRACRSLREAFLRLSSGLPLLLPRMDPIGDVDEEELSLNLSGMEDELSLPPVLPPLQRQFLLAKLIAAQGHGRGLEQDIVLAQALGRLMDQAYTEDLSLKNLPGAVDREDFASHWQVSLDFLSLLSEHWPSILAQYGVIDSADRRNRLLKRLAQHWSDHPPQHKIIAAGSTGSIPATERLLNTVARLPDGCIVLPGLDQFMDEASWKALDETHPQATMKNLIAKLNVDRRDVASWPAITKDSPWRKMLRDFTSEIMRPADTAQEWQTLKTRLPFSPEFMAIERYDCANPQEEALTIALALRRVLEEKSKTAALVTPDRHLARRVAMACRRWDIAIDDSGGQPLSETRAGLYLRLCMDAVCAGFTPVALLNFFKHALCLPPTEKNWRATVRKLDSTIFRGIALDGGFAAFAKKISARQALNLKTDGLAESIARIEHLYRPLASLAEDGALQPFDAWMTAHLNVAENFCAGDILWSNQDGEQASSLFSELRDHSGLLPPMTAADYGALLLQSMRVIPVRPRYGLHPRLMILGQLEARLVEADVMILSGLNEGTWPPRPSPDPWMSRPMRKRFGLPPPERSIGLSAHDFAQSLCAEKVILTRSLRVEGTPTVPSRWLQRMDTVLQAAGHASDSFRHGLLLAQARQLDQTEGYSHFERPAPRPPVDVRPRRLSVTKIETWMNDPYSIYARYILGLKPLDALEEKLDAKLRGTLIHKVLDRFVAAYPDALPPEAPLAFLSLAREEMEALSVGEDVKSFWEPRLMKISKWLVEKERVWRQTYMPAISGRENKGTMRFQGPGGPFTLSGVIDRADFTKDGKEAAIIDYKSGGGFTGKGMVNGAHPQLPLEALILESGGFEGLAPAEVSVLAYWVVNGSQGGGKSTELSGADLTAAKNNARNGLQRMIDAFDCEDTPYYSLPRPGKPPKYNDYEHLARVREWTALDENDPEQEDAA